MFSSDPIKVLVLHEDPVAREGLTSAFARYADLQVVDADAGREGLSSIAPPHLRHGADVVVADYDQGTKLAALASRQAGSGGACKVLVVTSNNREWEIRSALERGVRGYLVVGCALDELAAGVRSVFRGVRYLSPQVALRLAEILAGDPLTAREEEVLRLVVDGMGNKAIARRLGIAVGTVKSHLKGIFDKLDVGSRTQAICTAERRGLLRDAPPPERAVVVSEAAAAGTRLSTAPRVSQAIAARS